MSVATHSLVRTAKICLSESQQASHLTMCCAQMELSLCHAINTTVWPEVSIRSCCLPIECLSYCKQCFCAVLKWVSWKGVKSWLCRCAHCTERLLRFPECQVSVEQASVLSVFGAHAKGKATLGRSNWNGQVVAETVIVEHITDLRMVLAIHRTYWSIFVAKNDWGTVWWFHANVLTRYVWLLWCAFSVLPQLRFIQSPIHRKNKESQIVVFHSVVECWFDNQMGLLVKFIELLH